MIELDFMYLEFYYFAKSSWTSYLEEKMLIEAQQNSIRSSMVVALDSKTN